MNNITPYNEKGELHGYCEWYRTYNGSLMYKCFYHNGKEVGYSEHSWSNKLRGKTYYI